MYAGRDIKLVELIYLINTLNRTETKAETKQENLKEK